jgi:enterochelin esterase-like enzyme
MYEDGERRPMRIYQDVGFYENNTDRNREWKAVLTAKGYDVVYRERGATHHALHWAGTLPEALISLLPPRR